MQGERSGCKARLPTPASKSGKDEENTRELFSQAGGMRTVEEDTSASARSLLDHTETMRRSNLNSGFVLSPAPLETVDKPFVLSPTIIPILPIEVEASPVPKDVIIHSGSEDVEAHRKKAKIDVHATPSFLEVPSRRPCDTLIFGVAAR